MLKHCPAGLDADLAGYLAGDMVRDKVDEIDREVNSATLTLRELQRQMAVLRTRLPVLNSHRQFLQGTVRNVVTRLLVRTSLTMVISSPGRGQNLVRSTTVLVWTPVTNTFTPENGCAVLEAGVGGHVAGFTTAMVIV